MILTLGLGVAFPAHQPGSKLLTFKGVMKSNQRRPSKNSILEQLQDAQFPIECILDIGIHTCTPELMKNFPDLKHYLFEPIQDHFAIIEENYQKFGIDYDLIEVAVSNADGTADLRVSSVLEDQEVTHANFAEEGAAPESLRTVQTLKLDTFVATQNPPAPYLLKIDVDGAEEMILEGAQEALKNCSVLIIEAPRQRLVERAQLVQAAGFELLDVIDFCYYGGYLWQVDLVFINPKFAPTDYVDLLKDGFSIDKWHNFRVPRDKPTKKAKRRLSRLFRKKN
ncbi:FkbM family methyltransferase [Ruegeria arenilitoris]|uniref:FkbM family methyltransferase n=1 Tax=Ruegeria arenilitoris TaxID=1173585 RepID=UPI00147D538A|nr:FkbM family methyltransferase [Ruegeria arenilitoris]